MVVKKETPTFTKEQLLASSQFEPLQKDVLNALLADEEVYTLEQVKEKVEEFTKKVVE
jgi:hypothetical protein